MLLFMLKQHALISSKQTIRQYSSLIAEKWPTSKVRQTFIDYFCIENQHKFVESSSVIPPKGSGTYFTNAGMNQFKSIILGECKSYELFDFKKYKGLANSQKCIRIGGKHSDLDTIGKDDYHHTFFEMLGNWSFGTYDKEKACVLALNLLVNVYKLDISKLYFTYFNGNASLNLRPDLETKLIWSRLGVPERQILGFGVGENFWEMDATGPCGPCTEIHYNRTDETNEEMAKLVNRGDERVIELWNLVFMQYNRLSEKHFIDLPQMVVDTGCGLERLTSVLNNYKSNYDIDVFKCIFDQIDRSLPSQIQTQNTLFAYRTVSDHMRSICVAISDGLSPSRIGLGAYLKYLIIKTVKLCKNPFGIVNESDINRFMGSLVPVIAKSLYQAYPNISNDVDLIQETIQTVIESEREKHAKSKEICDRFIRKLKNPTQLTGKQVWHLHKGDGGGESVPVDFIENYAQLNSITIVNREQYDKILLNETENALKVAERKEKTKLIDLCIKLKDVSSTDDSYKHNFNMNVDLKEAQWQSGTLHLYLVLRV